MPQMGHDTKTDRLTDCQSQCDFDLNLVSVSGVASVASEECPSVRSAVECSRNCR
jgi:hypothetical protein